MPALLAAGALEAGAAEPEVLLPELPQAAIMSAAASPAGASQVLFIACPRFTWETGFLTLINVAARMFVHVPDWGL
jgi:hypothetical protein